MFEGCFVVVPLRGTVRLRLTGVSVGLLGVESQTDPEERLSNTREAVTLSKVSEANRSNVTQSIWLFVVRHFVPHGSPSVSESLCICFREVCLPKFLF